MRKARTGALLSSRSIKGGAARRGASQQQLAGGAAQFGFGDQAVDQTELERLLRAHGLAGEHHLHRGPHAERRTVRTVPPKPGCMPELYLRQPERQPFIATATR